MEFLKQRGKSFPMVAFFAVMIILSFIIKNGFYQHIFILTLFYAGMSSAWNIVGGYAGQLSLGHAAYMGIGAYTATLLYLKMGVSPWIGIIAAIIIAAAVSALISYPSFKLHGTFFAMSTLAFGEVMRIIANYWRGLTNGSVGLSIPFKPSLAHLMFEERVGYVYFAMIFLAVVLVISSRIKESRAGYYLNAIRENEIAARSLGINTSLYKLYASVISASLAAVGGVFYAFYILYIDPSGLMDSAISIQFTLMAIIGGLGTLWGPVVGAILIIPLSEFMRAWLGGVGQGLHLVIYGLIMVVVVIVSPGGLINGYKVIIRKIKKIKA